MRGAAGLSLRTILGTGKSGGPADGVRMIDGFPEAADGVLIPVTVGAGTLNQLVEVGTCGDGATGIPPPVHAVDNSTIGADTASAYLYLFATIDPPQRRRHYP